MKNFGWVWHTVLGVALCTVAIPNADHNTALILYLISLVCFFKTLES